MMRFFFLLSFFISFKVSALGIKGLKSPVHLIFTQEVYSKLRDRTTHLQGEAAFSPPNAFRWQVGQGPCWIWDGKILYQYDASLNKAWSYSKGERAGAVEQFASLLLRPEEAFHGERSTKDPLTWKLRPKKPGGDMTHLEAQWTSEGKPKFLKIFFQNGNTSTLKFSSHPKPVTSDLWTLPRGVSLLPGS